MKKLFLYAAIGFVFLQACKSGGKSTAEVPPNFNAANLFVHAKQLEKIVTIADVAAIAGVKTTEITAYQENFLDDAATQFLLFSWENGAEIEVGAQKIPGRSSIGFGRFEKILAPDFEQRYQQKTPEELKKDIEALTSDEAIDPDIAIWEAKEIAKTSKSQKFEKLENVGTIAYWQTPIDVLHVYVNGMAFSVSANFNDDEAKNKQKAIELAQLIFKQTKNESNN